MIAVLAGNPSVDRLHTVEILRIGEIHRPVRVVTLPGGKGVNVARALRALDGDAHVFGVLGGYSGRWIADALALEGIAATWAWSSSDTRSSFSVAQAARPGEPLTEFYEPAKPIAGEVWAELELRVEEALGDVGTLCISGGLIPGAPVDAFERAVRLAHDAGAKVALDSHGDAFAAALRAQPDLVKVNAGEAAEALGLEPPEHETLDWATAAAVDLRGCLGARGACVVTCGIRGMALVDDAGARYHGLLDEIGPYSVGSGDAVLAALALERGRGQPWPVALRAAIGAAAANAEVAGAGVLDRERAAEMARRATVRRVAA